VATPVDLDVFHVGSGRFRPGDRDHITYGIWRELASGFRHYHVVARSTAGSAEWTDANLKVTLIRSWFGRDAEFLISQFACVPMMMNERPDVIVCQSPAAGGLAALLGAAKTGARLLMELHSDVYFPPFHWGTRSWVYHHLSRPALRRATRIRVLSSGMKERLTLSYGEEIASKARVLPPRVDLSRFSPEARREGTSRALGLIMVGSVTPRKGQLRLIHALAAVPFAVELHLVGEGADLSECRNRAMHLNGNLRVVCHGAVQPAALPALIQQADVFVLYSKSEGTPRAIMEAMAGGVPIVTTNAGFCADIVENGREGFVLGPKPDDEIVETLDRFRSDPGLARRMGEAAHARAKRDYDSVRLFEAYRRLIAETAIQ
jgi:glycosyltransferase involved in cell wall biosynthesis